MTPRKPADKSASVNGWCSGPPKDFGEILGKLRLRLEPLVPGAHQPILNATPTPLSAQSKTGEFETTEDGGKPPHQRGDLQLGDLGLVSSSPY
jgi:hypothetical protein